MLSEIRYLLKVWISFIAGDLKLSLGRKPGVKNCQPFIRPKQKMAPKHWGPLKIQDPQVNTFTVRVGIAGGQKGYAGMTGKT